MVYDEPIEIFQSQVCSTSHHIGLHRFAVLPFYPLQAPKWPTTTSSTRLVANCLMLRGVDRQYALIMDDIKVTLVLQGKSLCDCGWSNLTQ